MPTSTNCEVRAMELHAVTTANDIGLASILKGVLESAGIEVVLAGSSLDTVYPASSLTEIRLLVREDDLDRARDVLAATEVQGIPGEDDEDEA
jgi:hypothetical protein